MRSARWLSARNFLCAGRAGFPEILQIFRAIFAQNLRYLDTDLASIRLRIVARELSCVRSARWPNARDFCKREQFFFRGVVVRIWTSEMVYFQRGSEPQFHHYS